MRTTHTASDGVQHLSVADAVDEVERCSFTTSPDEGEDEREVTHVFIGTMGADWNTSSVIEALQTADDIAWVDHWLWGECLAFIEDGKMRHCDNVRPLT